LELVDPNADNNVGSNWALSPNPGGSPGAANGSGTTNTPPTAAFTSLCPDLTCSFDGTSSHDSEGPIAGYAWTFGDGGTATGPNPSHTYTTAGNYNVTLTVTDGNGATNSVTQQVSPSVQSTPIAFVGAGHGQPGSVKTQSVVVPAAAKAGQTMLLWLTTGSTSVWSGPGGLAGWTQVDTFTNGSTTSTLWRRTVATGDAGKTVSFTSTVFHKAAVVLAVYSGVGSSAPVVARVGDKAKTAHVSPTVVAPAGSWVVTLWADKSETTTGWTAPSGVTTRDVGLGTGSGRFTSLLVDSGGPVSGTYGGLTATTNAANSYTDMWTIALPGS
jgi:PKD repeat protein